jgi:hypothetical protein
VAEADRQPGFRELEPVVVLRVTDSSGKVLYQQPDRSTRSVADPNLTYLITNILSDDDARIPTYGRNSPLQLTRPAAAKTGTTDRFTDSWVIGFTPDLLTGVWVGNNDGSPMRDVFGAQGAGKIYHAFMEAALAGTPVRQFVRPSAIVEREVCALSGLLPTADCPERVRELFAPNDLPTKTDDIYKRLEVCKKSGKLPNEFTPANGRESRLFAQFPEEYRAWLLQNSPQLGLPPPPPTEKCDDVYRGVKRAEITAPPPNLPVQGRVEIVGTAMMDDLDHLDLEAGEGPNPTSWIPITQGRKEGVDNALLGVWDTTRVRPGLYTLRLTLFDSLGNTQEGRAPLVVGPSATPTPVPSPAVVTPTPRATPGPVQPPQTGVPIPATPRATLTPTSTRR